MAILNITYSPAGLSSVNPNIIYVFTNDTLATVTTTGYLDAAIPIYGDIFSNYQMAVVYTSNAGTLLFQVSVVGKTASLISLTSSSEVFGPGSSTDNAIVRWNGATGTTIQNSVVTINDSGNAIGFGSLSAANNITSTTGDLQALIGNVLAGNLTGTGAGHFTSYPTTAAKGSLQLKAIDSSVDANVIISNASHAQSSTYSIPDGGQTTSNFIISNSTGTQIIATGDLEVGNISIGGSTITNTAAATDLNFQVTTSGNYNFKANNGAASQIRLYEKISSGTNYVGLKASDSITGDITYTLPAAPTVDGYVLASTTGGLMSWVSDSADTWTNQTTTPVTMAPGNSYSANNAGLVTLNMPATANFGDLFEIAGNGAGGWIIQMAAGQTANGSGGSTSVAGSLASTNRYDCVKLLCTVINTTFTIISSQGAITNA